MTNHTSSARLPNVYSETGRLRTVLVHRPGREIERLTRDNLRALLFEDFPYLDRMQDEHDAFVEVLRKDCGVEVLYAAEMLRECLADDKARISLIDDISRTERCIGIRDDLVQLNIDNMADVLVAGLSACEAAEMFGFTGPTDLASDYFIIPPVPNFYFMRDPSVSLGACTAFSRMHHSARAREPMLLEFVYRNHPRLNQFLTPVFGTHNEEQRPYTIEGGDVVIINEQAVAIGCSERTRSESIHRLARNLFRKDRFRRVYEVQIPFARDYMHLDTVLSIVGADLIVAYPDALRTVLETTVYEAQEIHGQIEAVPRLDRRPFLMVLEDEIGPFKVVPTGGDDPRHASREQIADASNVLAVAPNRVITYARNKHTNRALERAGVEVIQISDSELVRGLGGPRCMTMPLVREA